MSKKRPPNAEATEFRAGEQQVEIARQGGVASGIARREKKSLREAMQILMDADLTGKDGKTMTGTEAMAAKAFQAALKRRVEVSPSIVEAPLSAYYVPLLPVT